MAPSDFSHHFSSQNIPFGIASSKSHSDPQAVTRIENTVLFLHNLHHGGLFSGVEGLDDGVFLQPTLNKFASLPRSTHRSVREAISYAFKRGSFDAFPVEARSDIVDVETHLPISIGDFVDYSCSLEHVRNAGRVVLGNSSPPPAFFHFPIGYQSRTSSIVVSGAEIERPIGQYWSPTGDKSVVTAPSAKVDYELEIATVVGKPLPRGRRLLAPEADEYIFGFVLLNDWSSRDIQTFEMMPLGPLNGKNFGTTISPWIVTLDALEPFKIAAPPRQVAVPHYLDDPENTTYSIRVQVEILLDGKSTVIGSSSVESMYWTSRQMLAHTVSSGGALRTGDIMASGTVSGVGKEMRGCLLETTEGGKVPIRLADGTKRAYLEDGDVVRLTGIAGSEGSGVGFGECVGKLLPSRPFP